MSNRAARRAAAKQGKVVPKEKVYTLTESQIADMLAKERRKAYEEASKIAGQKSVDIAWQLMLAIPCEVLLGDDYWPKTAKKRLPKFVDDCLSLYDSYNAGVLILAELREDLWKWGGVKLEVDESVKDA